MKKYLVAVALILGLLGCTVLPVKEEVRFVAVLENNAIVTLTDTPCSRKDILENIHPEYQQYFYAGSVIFGKAKLQLCWALRDGMVLIIDEEGDSASLPLYLFSSPKPEGI